MNLQNRLERKTARIAVVGQGYVGLPLAVEFARSGFRVTGIDADSERVAALSRGDSYIPDVPDEDLRQMIGPVSSPRLAANDVTGPSGPRRLVGLRYRDRGRPQP